MFRKMIKSLLYMHGFGDINNSDKSVPKNDLFKGIKYA